MFVRLIHPSDWVVSCTDRCRFDSELLKGLYMEEIMICC